MDFTELENRLLFAIPKKGRLYEKTLQLLEGADIQFRRSNRLDIALSTNFPIALVFLGASDIAKFVALGNVDLGITGHDMLIENEARVDHLLDLGFGKCELCVQVPISSGITNPRDLIGKRIVTSFETVTKRYFQALESEKFIDDIKSNLKEPNPFEGEINTKVTYVGGSVEAACALGLADAIVDLVESGETMRAAKLQRIETLVTSEAVLISNPRKHSNNPLVETIKRRIEGVITAQKYVICTYNILRSNLSNAKKITPGKKAPTVSPLDDEKWVAVSSMVPKKKIAEVMDTLTSIGAEDILILAIHNCRT